jgi:hypothetical protein
MGVAAERANHFLHIGFISFFLVFHFCRHPFFDSNFSKHRRKRRSSLADVHAPQLQDIRHVNHERKRL